MKISILFSASEGKNQKNSFAAGAKEFFAESVFRPLRSRPGILFHRKADVGQALDVVEEPLTGRGLFAKLYAGRRVGSAAFDVKGRPVFVIEGIGVFDDLDGVRNGRLVSVLRGRALEKGKRLVGFTSEPFADELLFKGAHLARTFKEIEHFKGGVGAVPVIAKHRNGQSGGLEGRIEGRFGKDVEG